MFFFAFWACFQFCLCSVYVSSKNRDFIKNNLGKGITKFIKHVLKNKLVNGYKRSLTFSIFEYLYTLNLSIE